MAVGQFLGATRADDDGLLGLVLWPLDHGPVEDDPGVAFDAGNEPVTLVALLEGGPDGAGAFDGGGAAEDFDAAGEGLAAFPQQLDGVAFVTGAGVGAVDFVGDEDGAGALPQTWGAVGAHEKNAAAIEFLYEDGVAGVAASRWGEEVVELGGGANHRGVFLFGVLFGAVDGGIHHDAVCR